jgi:peroxiredoxin
MSEPSPYDAIAKVFERVRDLDAPLNSRLLLLAEAVREDSPEFGRAVDGLIARLAHAGLGMTAPAVGEVLPNFLLPDQTGRLLSLESVLERGPAVISFHRGHWCPYCRLTAFSFADLQDEIGVAHMVAITPETRTWNARFAEDAGIGYPVLTDPDAGYALSLNLAFWIDDRFAELMRNIGQDISAYQSAGAWVLPIPATFVVDSGGRVVARHVDPDYRRRMEIDDLVDAFRQAD